MTGHRRRPADMRRRREGGEAATDALSGARQAPVKNPEDLTGAQRTTAASIAKTNKKLSTGYGETAKSAPSSMPG
jgi:hypothetical protein